MKTSTILRSLEVLPGAIWTVCHSLAFVHLQCYHAKGQFSTVSTETFFWPIIKKHIQQKCWKKPPLKTMVGQELAIYNNANWPQNDPRVFECFQHHRMFESCLKDSTHLPWWPRGNDWRCSYEAILRCCPIPSFYQMQWCLCWCKSYHVGNFGEKRPFRNDGFDSRKKKCGKQLESKMAFVRVCYYL